MSIRIMKKILFLVFWLLSVGLLFYSCGGTYSVFLDVQFYLQKEDGSNFSESELYKFKYSSNGIISGSYSAEKFIPTVQDSRITVQYYLGSSSFSSEIKRIEQSYKERMKYIWFKIEDVSGIYKIYEMKPLDGTKYEFIENRSKPSIKYIVKLKQK